MGIRRLAGAAIAIVAAGRCLWRLCASTSSAACSPLVGAGGAAPLTTACFAAKPRARRRPEPQASAPKPAAVSVAAVTRADYPVFIDGARPGPGLEHGDGAHARRRPDRQDRLQGRPDGQGGRSARRRSIRAPFQAALDQAKAKKAQDEATLANAKLDLQRYSTLAKQSFATQQQLDTQNALVNQLHRAASPPTPRRSTRPRCSSTTRRSPRRSPAASASAWSTKAISSTRRSRPASSPSPRSSRSRSSSPRRRTTCRRIIRGARRRRAARSRSRTSDGATLLATGKLTVIDNQVDAADRHDPAQGRVRQRGPRAVARPGGRPCGCASRSRRTR